MSGVRTPSLWDIGQDPALRAPPRVLLDGKEPRRGIHGFQGRLCDRISLNFGKYKGKTPEGIAAFDSDYLVWLKEKSLKYGGYVSDHLISQIKASAQP